MSITFEALDKLEAEVKEALEETKANLTKTSERQRVLLMRIAAIRGSKVIELNKEAE